MRARGSTVHVWMAAGIVMQLGVAAADDAARPGELIQEAPTLKCLGVRWPIAGDDNHNARVAVEYRKAGTAEWKKAMDLFRVDSSGMRPPVRPPAGTTLLAGSILNLEENTEY